MQHRQPAGHQKHINKGFPLDSRNKLPQRGCVQEVAPSGWIEGECCVSVCPVKISIATPLKVNDQNVGAIKG
jgi:hypothetical protein